MFESRIDFTDLSSVLTDARKAAVSLATNATQKSADFRAEMTSRSTHRADVARLQTRALATRLDKLATKAEVRLDPMVAKFIGRLPSPLDRVATDMNKQAKQLRAASRELVLKTLAPKVAPVAPQGANKATKATKVAKVATASKTVTRRKAAKA